MYSSDELDALYVALRESGFKVTQARRAVIECLATTSTHLTAPGIVDAVQERAPGVGRASVYRTLELLTQMGGVQSSTLGRANATYVLTPDKHHHHVVCLDCHKTVELDHCVIDDLVDRLDQLGFQFEGHLVELYGRCPDCLG